MRILSILFFGGCGCSNYCSTARMGPTYGNIYIDRKLMKFRIDLHFDKTSCDDWFESSIGKSIVDDVLRAPLYTSFRTLFQVVVSINEEMILSCGDSMLHLCFQ